MLAQKDDYNMEDNIGSINRGASTGTTTVTSTDPAIQVTQAGSNFALSLNDQNVVLPVLTTDLTAGESFSALKLVCLKTDGKLYVANSNTIYEEALVLGVAAQAAPLINDTVKVILGGIYEDSSWSWSSNELLFLNNLGNITNVAPITGHRTKIGKALTATKILIEIEEPIILS